jgi:hypothetical protein
MMTYGYLFGNDYDERKPILLRQSNEMHLEMLTYPAANAFEVFNSALTTVAGVIISPLYDTCDSGSDYHDRRGGMTIQSVANGR